jgi:hypothetical protein
MKKRSVLVPAMLLATVFSCNNTSNTQTGATATAQNDAPAGKALYFDYSIDGKEMHVLAEDILTSYNVTSADTVFKIFAGKDGGITLLLTIPRNMAKPSTTPSGSPDFKYNITQGSVSLQNYPDKNFTSNNFNTTYPATAIPVPDAIVVTSSETDGTEGRIITGTINTKTFGDEDPAKEPSPKDHIIKGKFRIKHPFNGYKF